MALQTYGHYYYKFAAAVYSVKMFFVFFNREHATHVEFSPEA